MQPFVFCLLLTAYDEGIKEQKVHTYQNVLSFVFRFLVMGDGSRSPRPKFYLFLFISDECAEKAPYRDKSQQDCIPVALWKVLPQDPSTTLSAPF